MGRVQILWHMPKNWRDATKKKAVTRSSAVLLNKPNLSKHVIFQRVSTGVTGKSKSVKEQCVSHSEAERTQSSKGFYSLNWDKWTNSISLTYKLNYPIIISKGAKVEKEELEKEKKIVSKN